MKPSLLVAEPKFNQNLHFIDGPHGLDPLLDLDSKIFLGQSVAQSFARTCSAIAIIHISNFEVLAQIL